MLTITGSPSTVGPHPAASPLVGTRSHPARNDVHTPSAREVVLSRRGSGNLETASQSLGHSDRSSQIQEPRDARERPAGTDSGASGALVSQDMARQPDLQQISGSANCDQSNRVHHGKLLPSHALPNHVLQNSLHPVGSEPVRESQAKENQDGGNQSDNQSGNQTKSGLDDACPGPRVVSLGCRLNTAESDAMQTWAKAHHMDNAIIINTCAVTAEAERQARQTIRRLRRDNPDAYIIATGCAVQMRPQVFAKMPEIDRVLGNGAKTSPDNFSKSDQPRVVLSPLPQTLDNQLPLAPLAGRSKVFVQIQNGCDHNCSYCTITIARGRSRSVPFPQILAYVRHALDQGVQEIVLTGVDLTSYNHDGWRLGQVIQGLLKEIPDLKRLRISSMDSMEVDPLLFDLIAYEPRVLPHIHLSLQSGNDSILRAMKRRHTAAQAVDLCTQLRQARPGLALGADFIVGFPGETDAMFDDTWRHVQDCGLTHLHVFPFSGRPGTLAARLPDQVPAPLIKSRASTLRALGQDQRQSWLARHQGSTLWVLAENPHFGHTDDFCPVHFLAPAPACKVIQAHIVRVEGDHLLASPVEEASSPANATFLPNADSLLIDSVPGHPFPADSLWERSGP